MSIGFFPGRRSLTSTTSHDFYEKTRNESLDNLISQLLAAKCVENPDQPENMMVPLFTPYEIETNKRMGKVTGSDDLERALKLLARVNELVGGEEVLRKLTFKTRTSGEEAYFEISKADYSLLKSQLTNVVAAPHYSA